MDGERLCSPDRDGKIFPLLGNQEGGVQNVGSDGEFAAGKGVPSNHRMQGVNRGVWVDHDLEVGRSGSEWPIPFVALQGRARHMNCVCATKGSQWTE